MDNYEAPICTFDENPNIVKEPEKQEKPIHKLNAHEKDMKANSKLFHSVTYNQFMTAQPTYSSRKFIEKRMTRELKVNHTGRPSPFKQ